MSWADSGAGLLAGRQADCTDKKVGKVALDRHIVGHSGQSAGADNMLTLYVLGTVDV